MSSLRALIAIFALLMAGIVVSPAAQAGGDKDCGDFATQAGAQDFFLDNGGPQNDPHQLDADGDGVACESNPCPCSTDQGGGGDGGGGGGNGGGGQDKDPVKRDKAKVIRVVDGDTVRVNMTNGPKVFIRVLGIDTPEVFGGEECHGPQASTAMKKTLPRGTVVQLTSDPSQDLKDRYGRLLRYIEKRNVDDVGRRLVRRGHARVYVYNDNPFQRTKTYRKAQSKAKNQDLGLWGHC